MDAATTGWAERAGRDNSSASVIFRAGTTLAACQANMESICRGVLAPAGLYPGHRAQG